MVDQDPRAFDKTVCGRLVRQVDLDQLAADLDAEAQAVPLGRQPGWKRTCPSASRRPPKPATSASQVPPQEAMWMPSAVLPCVSSRSPADASMKYSSAASE